MVNYSAKRLILVLVCSIFLSEILIMASLAFFPPMSLSIEALLDAILLVFLNVPVLYLFVFNPLVGSVTALKLAEEKLSVTAAAFETHEAIMITDADANIIRVNKEFERVTGYLEAEVLGKNPRLFKSDRHNADFYARMWQTLKAEGTWSGEIWDKHKDGRDYPKEMTISAVKNDALQIAQYVCIFSDISQRKQAEEEIHKLAYYDALTGLSNRRRLMDKLNHALCFTDRSHHYGALVLLDLDDFKILNDTLGHDYGDLLLIQVAERLKIFVREIDTVARLGGDEFVVLFEEVHPLESEASKIVAQITERIRETLIAPYHLREQTYYLSASMGVSMFNGATETIESLIKHADLAMYQAKEAGRNKVKFFDPKMQQLLEARAQMDRDLRAASKEKAFELYYQVQLDRLMRPVGAEALIRWHHPEKGFIPPSQFIPIAEESFLILEIGDWVLNAAAQQLAKWKGDAVFGELVLAVNISAKQFKQADFVEDIVQLIQQYGFDPAKLKLELTESIVLEDLDFVRSKMFALRMVVGVSLSLDDFGTGYSSLSYLKQLPVDQLKIDQSFVRELTSHEGDVMVKAIISMAENFNLDVIAEGVETQQQLDYLLQGGCKLYQGYLFGKPLPINEFELAFQEKRYLPRSTLSAD